MLATYTGHSTENHAAYLRTLSLSLRRITMVTQAAPQVQDQLVRTEVDRGSHLEQGRPSRLGRPPLAERAQHATSHVEESMPSRGPAQSPQPPQLALTRRRMLRGPAVPPVPLVPPARATRRNGGCRLSVVLVTEDINAVVSPGLPGCADQRWWSFVICPDDIEGTSVLTDGLLDALCDDPFVVLLGGYRT